MGEVESMTVSADGFFDESTHEHPRLSRWAVDPVKPIIEGYRVGRVAEPWFTRDDARRVSWVDVPSFDERSGRKRAVADWIEEEFPEIADSAEDSVCYEFCAYEGDPKIILCQINWAN
ncbi:hypothetical protein EYE40_03005 [Glaciihabitans arcticus]|uniref:Uncharacterized protein n=1 Tax=Glaciihabitans arcticus TaxID=2668039 RepID=A0A4Q9GS65_9MICO|nr:hypothetical protein [Glaciihabitans arcticus]TBN56448.1 hypothetical protein EYE40_03005 [Glaciihabitans arcticus]